MSCCKDPPSPPPATTDNDHSSSSHMPRPALSHQQPLAPSPEHSCSTRRHSRPRPPCLTHPHPPFLLSLLPVCPCKRPLSENKAEESGPRDPVSVAGSLPCLFALQKSPSFSTHPPLPLPALVSPSFAKGTAYAQPPRRPARPPAASHEYYSIPYTIYYHIPAATAQSKPDPDCHNPPRPAWLRRPPRPAGATPCVRPSALVNKNGFISPRARSVALPFALHRHYSCADLARHSEFSFAGGFPV